MIARDILQESRYLLGQFRAMCITGPRQSGKTTLSKTLFKGKPYISFETLQIQAAADENIAVFMNQYNKGAILDEVQRVQDIFRQLQAIPDRNNRRGQFILTGSNNFLLQEQISLPADLC
jgi:predicted AAA+ superfamily ATPase